MIEEKKQRLLKAADDYLSSAKRSLNSGNLILAKGQALRAYKFLRDVSKDEDRILPPVTE